MDLTTADPLIGQLFDGRYRVDARVARGGMATVYTGFDTRLDRIVAVKVMHQTLAEDDAFVSRFHREAKAAARLQHPNVVAIYDQGSDAGRVFLVMEHIDGGTLRDRLRSEGRLSPARALGVMEQVLHALAAAHDAGLVHRDVKPENILIAADGRVKVADFGLARAVETTGMTTTGLLIGTVSYLAPEQVESGRADKRSDVYSAGIVLFELLTGAPPYDGETPLSVAYRHVNDVVPAPSTILRGVPPELDELVQRATHRDPDARPASARDLLVGVRRAQQAVARSGATTALRPILDAPTVVTSLPAARRGGSHHTRVLRTQTGQSPVATPARRRRGPRGGPVAAVIIAALLAGASFVGWQLGLGNKPGRAAQRSTGSPAAATSSAAAASVAVSSAAAPATSAAPTSQAAPSSTAPAPPPPITTPDVSGSTFEAAVAALVQRGFARPTRRDVFDESVPAGKVKDQFPKPNVSTTAGAGVQLVVSKGQERIGVPEIVGTTRTKALAALTAANLTAVEPLTLRYDEKVPAGNVIGVTPPALQQVKPRTPVTLVISKGREPIPVPALAGKTFAAAAAAIADSKLNLTRTNVHSETVKSGLVIKASPAKGTLFRGDSVALTVSKGPAPVAMPNVVGMSRTTAIAKIQALGLRVNPVDFPGLKGKTVARQLPRTGVLVPKGNTVTIYLV